MHKNSSGAYITYLYGPNLDNATESNRLRHTIATRLWLCNADTWLLRSYLSWFAGDLAVPSPNHTLVIYLISIIICSVLSIVSGTAFESVLNMPMLLTSKLHMLFIAGSIIHFYIITQQIKKHRPKIYFLDDWPYTTRVATPPLSRSLLLNSLCQKLKSEWCTRIQYLRYIRFKPHLLR